MPTYNTRPFVLHRQMPDQVTYAGPDHTFSGHESFTLVRKEPVPQKGNLGYLRTEARFRQTEDRVGSPDSLRDDVNLRTLSTLPVGIDDARVDAAIATFRAFVASADFVALVKTGKI